MTQEEIYEYCRSEGLEYHHSAIMQGYVAKAGIKTTGYRGRFGSGVVVHLPTTQLYNKTKRFHPVEYWLFPETVPEEYKDYDKR